MIFYSPLCDPAQDRNLLNAESERIPHPPRLPPLLIDRRPVHRNKPPSEGQRVRQMAGGPCGPVLLQLLDKLVQRDDLVAYNLLKRCHCRCRSLQCRKSYQRRAAEHPGDNARHVISQSPHLQCPPSIVMLTFFRRPCKIAAATLQTAIRRTFGSLQSMEGLPDRV